jgi:hypothetical protein
MHGTISLVAVMKEHQICHPGLFEAEPWRGSRARGDYALRTGLLAKKTIDVQSYVTRIIPWEEVDRIAELAFERLLEKEVKVGVRSVENNADWTPPSRGATPRTNFLHFFHADFDKVPSWIWSALPLLGQ